MGHFRRAWQNQNLILIKTQESFVYTHLYLSNERERGEQKQNFVYMKV